MKQSAIDDGLRWCTGGRNRPTVNGDGRRPSGARGAKQRQSDAAGRPTLQVRVEKYTAGKAAAASARAGAGRRHSVEGADRPPQARRARSSCQRSADPAGRRARPSLQLRARVHAAAAAAAALRAAAAAQPRCARVGSRRPKAGQTGGCPVLRPLCRLWPSQSAGVWVGAHPLTLTLTLLKLGSCSPSQLGGSMKSVRRMSR